MYDIVTVGDATIDTFLVLREGVQTCSLDAAQGHLCLQYADKIPIQESHQAVGGNAANVAVATATLGLRSAIIADLGEDVNGLTIKDELEQRHVDTKFLKLDPKTTTRYSVILNFMGERTVLSSHMKRTYQLPRMPRTRWLYMTSMGAGFEKIQQEIITLKKKRGQNMLLAMNPGSYQAKEKPAALRKVLPFLDALFVNKEELFLLSETHTSIKAGISVLHKKGVKLVVVTDGEAGSYASDGLHMYHMPIYPIKAIAKTGAGDAYAASFLAATLQGLPLAECMQWGTANAAGVIQKFGAQQGLQSAKGIRTLLSKYQKVLPEQLSI